LETTYSWPGPLNAFPWVLNGLIEALVSIRRLEQFLGLPDFCREEYYSRMYDIIQPQANTSTASSDYWIR
jgi:hypothetical protein